jgi:threonylcarbamoyladenosine tRNA methylthiotransferase MtaB
LELSSTCPWFSGMRRFLQMANGKKFKLITLGCKVNQAESQEFGRDLMGAGLERAEKGEKADVIIVNTCCVTRIAERKSRKAIRYAQTRNPGAEVWVTGCSVDLDKDLGKKVPGVKKLFANKEKDGLRREIGAGRLEAKEALKDRPASPEDIRAGASGVSLTANEISPRAMLRVATGCNERCSYCIVPIVRGPVKSRPLSEILDEARSLIAEGKKELILTAINLGLYGQDKAPNNEALRDLLLKLSELPGLLRLRLSSLEPMYFTDDLIEFLLKTPKICPHFYIPLQSGSDRILNLMGRRYTTAEFLRIVERIRAIDPEASINTDVIVGFPGEDRSDFKQTCEFIEKAGFSRIHVFPFSVRPGTLAAGLPDQLSGREIKERAGRLNALRHRLMLDFHRRFVGRTVEVLAEQFHPATGQLEGLTGNYLRILFPGSLEHVGQLVLVKIMEAGQEQLLGDMERHESK